MLERYCATLFGKQCGLFIPSGTMSNQIAASTLVSYGEELICDAACHLNFFEAAQFSAFCSGSLNIVQTTNGIVDVDWLEQAMRCRARWSISYSSVRAVWIENSICSLGGTIFPFDTLKSVYSWCCAHKISLFIDGARLLNAALATGISAKDYAAHCTALTVCFSKGLGAPFGSVLLGDSEFIERARTKRKWFGGGLHQAGLMAAAAMYAIKNNQNQLIVDNANAAHLSKELACEPQWEVRWGGTNMVIIDLKRCDMPAARLAEFARREGVMLLPWRPYELRAVTSHNVTEAMTTSAAEILIRGFHHLNSTQPSGSLAPLLA
jgi:threonine aldolase